MLYTALNPDGEYFDITAFSYDAVHAGCTVTYSNWHRPLQSMSDAFTAASFRITFITEPPIDPNTPLDLLPLELQARKQPAPFISFVFFVLEAF
jgi:hypothetical protein